MRNVNNGVGNEIKQGLYYGPLTLMSNRVAVGDQAWLDHMVSPAPSAVGGGGRGGSMQTHGQSPCIHTADVY